MIAPPGPARNYLPDWFRKLPAVDNAVASKTDSGLTIKRCMRFLDAMSAGWSAANSNRGRYPAARKDRCPDR